MYPPCGKRGISAVVGLIIVLVIMSSAGAVILLRGPERAVHLLVLSVEPTAIVGESSEITVLAYDSENRPVSGLEISLFVLALENGYGGDCEFELPLEDLGGGRYTASFVSTWAGVYYLSAECGDTSASGSIEFKTGAPERIDLIRSEWDSDVLEFEFYLSDRYGNAVENFTPRVLSDMAKLENLERNPNGSWTARLAPISWGVENVTIVDNLSGISENFEVEFGPLDVEIERELSPLSIEYVEENGWIHAIWPENDNVCLLKFSILWPEGKFVKYEATLEYDESLLEMIDVMDGNPLDGFDEPSILALSDNSIKLVGSGSEEPGRISIFNVLFEYEFDVYNTRGESSPEVVVKELVLYEEEKKPVYVKDHLVDYETVLVPIDIPAPFVPHITVLKPLKRIIVPVKKWVFKESGISPSDAHREFEKAEKVYHKAAKACKLDYWIIFLDEVNELPKEKWDEYVGDDGKLNAYGEYRRMLDDGWPHDKWVNVFNVFPCCLVSPKSGKNLIGVRIRWKTDGKSGVWTDKSKDIHDRNIAHEFMHVFSNSRIKDSPDNASQAQGGREPNNIMRYCGGGKEISSEQGKILSEELGKKAELYDADGDGKPDGYVYRP